MPSQTIGKTISVAVGVCVVCSVFVSTASVCLKDLQDYNKTLDKRKNILIAAGLAEPGESVDVDALFKQIDEQWVELSTGEFVEEVPPECQDERKAAKDPDHSEPIQNNLAGLGRKARYRKLYFTREGQDIDRVILPVHGKGLWSTMYGFLALGSDLTTIKSFAFYEHGETPGLGGEVDNPRWKRSWLDKKAFDDSRQPQVDVVKGMARPGKIHEVDGLSGATLTARGVENLVQFWLGDEGYGPFLKKIGEGGGRG